MKISSVELGQKVWLKKSCSFHHMVAQPITVSGIYTNPRNGMKRIVCGNLKLRPEHLAPFNCQDYYCGNCPLHCNEKG